MRKTKIAAEIVQNGQKNEYPMTDYLDSILPKNRNFTIKEYPQLLSVHASIWAALYKRKFLLEKSCDEDTRIR